MSNYSVMIPSATPGAALSSPPYPTIEDALSGAKFMLANGATSAWIVDAKGSLALPAEQVRSRLNLLNESDRSPVQTGHRAATWLQLFWPLFGRDVSPN
jgi:hypothetical protein